MIKKGEIGQYLIPLSPYSSVIIHFKIYLCPLLNKNKNNISLLLREVHFFNLKS